MMSSRHGVFASSLGRVLQAILISLLVWLGGLVGLWAYKLFVRGMGGTTGGIGVTGDYTGKLRGKCAVSGSCAHEA